MRQTTKNKIELFSWAGFVVTMFGTMIVCLILSGTIR
jgi:hypothetical protein